MTIGIEVDARKEAVSAAEVWGRLQGAGKVVVARGRTVDVYLPANAGKDVLLAQVLGRSGTLRAPTLQVGQTYYVGFNENMYKEMA